MSEINWRVGSMDHLESPWGNAGGVVKKIEDVERMAKTGVGWIEAGSYTLEPRQGNKATAVARMSAEERETNPAIDYYHDSQTGETTNSLGMPNNGMDKIEKEIPEMQRLAKAHGKNLVVNVAPVTTEPVAETRELVSRALSAGARKVLLNLGCPNVIGADGTSHEPMSYHYKVVRDVLLGARPTLERYGQKLAVRTSPFDSYDRAKLVYRNIEASRAVDSVWLPNTWPLGGLPSPLGVAGGGRSGPKWADEAALQTRWAVEIFKGSKINIVSSAGIMDAKELRRRLALGAVAGAGTTFYYEAQEQWTEATDRLLLGLAD